MSEQDPELFSTVLLGIEQASAVHGYFEELFRLVVFGDCSAPSVTIFQIEAIHRALGTRIRFLIDRTSVA